MKKLQYFWISCIIFGFSNFICNGAEIKECTTSNLGIHGVPGAAPVEINELFDIFAVTSTVGEEAVQTTKLFTLKWSVAPNNIQADSSQNGWNYIQGECSNDKSQCDFILKSSLLHVPDFGQDPPTNLKELKLKYELAYDDLTCTIDIRQTITDENTCSPELVNTPLKIYVREDFPLNLPLEEKLIVRDLDGSEENTDVSVSFNPECPLKASDPTINCFGQDKEVILKLKEHLDYETASKVDCTVTLENTVPSDPVEYSIEIHVVEYPDEPPKFEHNFYSITLTSLLVADNNPLNVEQGPIKAEDQDRPQADITYKITDIKDDGKWDSYFEIGKNSGVISQSKDIPESEIKDGFIIFSIEASDDMDTVAAVLEISLPSIPETTTTTETTETTPSTPSSSTPITTAITPDDGTTTPPLTNPKVHFKFNTYSFAIFDQTLEVGKVELEDDTQEVTFVFDDACDPPYSRDFFELNEKTGKIRTKGIPPLGSYKLIAKAIGTHNTDMTTVNTVVQSTVVKDYPLLKQSLYMKEISEFEEPGYKIAEIIPDASSQEITQYSMIVEPEQYLDKFSIIMDASTGIGTLNLMEKLDAEDSLGTKIKIKVAGLNENIPSMNNDIDELERNEAMIELTVVNENDEPPTFPTEELLLGLPEDMALRRATNELYQIKATDPDGDDLTYSLGRTDEGFFIDPKTGSLYPKSTIGCISQCSLTVTVSDGKYEAQVKVVVVSLTLENIFTIKLDNIKNIEDIENKLEDLSKQAEISIRQFYFYFDTPKNIVFRNTEEDSPVEVEVYAFDEKKLPLTLDQFISKIGEVDSNMKPEAYNDEVLLSSTQTDEDNLLSYQIATAVLGALLGIVLVSALIAVSCVQYYKHKEVKPTEHKEISSLGHIYANDGLDLKSENEIDDVIFAKENENINNHEKIRRMYPEESSRRNSKDVTDSRINIQDEPYQKNVQNDYKPVYKDNSLEHRINLGYQKDIKNTQNYDEKLPTVKYVLNSEAKLPPAKKSILKNNSTNLNNNPPVEPTKDYDVKAATFSEVRKTPPPNNKSSNFLLENNPKNEDNNNDGLSKKSILKNESENSDKNDPNKRVDFKVLVDTIEIERREKKGGNKKSKEKEISSEDEEEDESVQM